MFSTQTVQGKANTHTFPCELTVIQCKCGGVYAIHERFREQKHIEGAGWNCPYCQTGWGYFGETALAKEQRLRKEAEDRLLRERARADQDKARLKEQRDYAKAQTRAQKAAKTKLKKRIAAGMCPCCQRPFANLMRHMQNQHPDFTHAE
jgi:hypothetical protein